MTFDQSAQENVKFTIAYKKHDTPKKLKICTCCIYVYIDNGIIYSDKGFAFSWFKCVFVVGWFCTYIIHFVYLF